MVDLIDTNGVKPTLKKGVLGYDDYNAGGDAGRLYVGTGTASIAQAKKSEVDLKVDKITGVTNDLVKSSNTTGSITNSRITEDTNGNVGIGITPSAWQSSLLKGIDLGDSGAVHGYYSSGTSGVELNGNSYRDNSGNYFYKKSNGASKYAAYNGSHYWSTAPSGIAGNAITWTNAMTLDASGNLLLTSGTGALGYGTGAGGTVTQATSKGTAVTLNKPCGIITTNNAALAAGATVRFTLNNYLIAQNDTCVCTSNNGNYEAKAYVTSTGLAFIAITNITGGSLSEAINVPFTIIKGATA